MDWANLGLALLVPAGFLAAGLVVFWIARRDDRRDHHTPAE
jgi:hypothetical protein